MLFIKKRDGREVPFDQNKIIDAVLAAFEEVDGELTDYAYEKAGNIADFIMEKSAETGHFLTVEEIQDLVENGLMSTRRKDVAKAYMLYRDERSRARGNTTDKDIQELLSRASEYWMNENSNKNPILNTTVRDYIAGIVSTDSTKRKYLPKDIVEAHEEGIIHFHDADYFIQTEHNCDLANLEDMLQNGTVISGVQIDKPKSFATACTVATQAIAQISSSQYGGQSISLSHLAPFVDISRQKLRKEVREELDNLSKNDSNLYFTDEQVNEIAEKRLKKEVASGIQTIQYQVVTLMTTNGQAPFITVFMYLDEVEDEQTRDDLALMIEETLKQRIKGVKNEQGVYITPAFPKLIYVLDEDNIYEDSKYYYLTKLAAECSAKRLVPDYISAKVMKELKGGDVYTCMGCRSFLTVDRCSDVVGNVANAGNYVEGKKKYYGRLTA